MLPRASRVLEHHSGVKGAGRKGTVKDPRFSCFHVFSGATLPGITSADRKTRQ